MPAEYLWILVSCSSFLKHELHCLACLISSDNIVLPGLVSPEAELVLAWKIVVLIVFSDHVIYGHMDTQLFTFTGHVTRHTTDSGHGKIE